MADLSASVDVITRTLRRTPRGEQLNWDIDIEEGLVISIDPNDLQELLGNIIDNAVKWSRSVVRIHAHKRDEKIVLGIEDDGPGATPDGLSMIMGRGTRLDLQTPGNGIGLAIVIAAMYDLSVDMRNLDTGGLQVIICFRGSSVFGRTPPGPKTIQGD